MISDYINGVKANLFGNCFEKNLWYFEAGSTLNTEKYMEFIYETVSNSFVQITEKSGGFPENISYGGRSPYLHANQLTTALLIPTLLKVNNKLYSNKIFDQFSVRWLTTVLLAEDHPVEYDTSYDHAAVLLAIIALYESGHDAVDFNLLKQVSDSVINKYEKWNNGHNKGSTANQLSHDSMVGYSIVSVANALENNYYQDFGLEILKICIEKYPFGLLVMDGIQKEPKDKNIINLRSFLILIEALINTAIVTGQNKWIDTVLPFILRLHQKFEISRTLLKTEYNFNWKPVSRQIDIISNPHIASIWFTVGLHLNDNLLLNSAFKMMDILRGVILSNSTHNLGFPVHFPPRGISSPVVINNISAKYFLEASAKELEARKFFE
jgi:hypothetical protein